MLALEAEDGQRDLRRHERVAVAVSADPGAEAQRPATRRELGAEAAKLDGEIIEQVGNDELGQLVEVEQRRARFVERGRPLTTDLLGLPEQVDELGQPPFRTRHGRHRTIAHRCVAATAWRPAAAGSGWNDATTPWDEP